MSTTAKAIAILAVVLALGAGLVVWKQKVGGSHGGGHGSGKALTKLTKEDMQILLKDANPMVLKQLSENAEMKQKQVDNLKELLAVANQARKEGLAERPDIKSELEDVRAQIVALNYDREKNKGNDQMPPLSMIKEEEIKAYFDKPGNLPAFDKMLQGKLEQAKKEGKIPQDRQLTEEEINEVKDSYARVRIYEAEAGTKAKELGPEYARKVELQVQLQQAAILNQYYADEVVKEKVKVTDEEVQQYIAQHPELDPKAKGAKALEILNRAKAGEDFAALAKEFSEDPGSKEKGGLYDGIKKGQMVPEFEQAALALEPGKVADSPVETKYGYHIIKLEKKGTAKGDDGKPEETYDARHILISTMFSDPTNPFAPPMSLTDKVKADLQAEKTKKIIEEIKAKNPIVIEDFEVPKPSEEQLRQMMQQRQPQQMSPEDLQQMMEEQGGGAEADAPTPTPKKPAPKKK